MATENYERAERFLHWNADKYVRNGKVNHHWVEDSDLFWYARDIPEGKSYILADATTGFRRPAFDHHKIAARLSAVTGEEVAPFNIRLRSFKKTSEGDVIQVAVAKNIWACPLTQNGCAPLSSSMDKPGDLVSPDGRRALFSEGDNLYLRDLSDGEVTPLTRDGQTHYSYGKLSDSSTRSVTLRRWKVSIPPVAVWSPDSTKIITHKLDERNVLDLHLLQHVPEDGSARPILYSYRYAMPGDEHIIKSEMVIFDVATGRRIPVEHNAFDVTMISPLAEGRVWWGKNNEYVYIIPRNRTQRNQKLLKIEARTGVVSELIEERSETYTDARAKTYGTPTSRTLASGEIIWYSERDGWGHLYRYNKNGELMNQITTGAWQVRKIAYIDEAKGRVYFTAGGREAGIDPYYSHLYSVNLDGSEMKLLTPEAANHQIKVSTSSLMGILLNHPKADEVAFSPSGRYFVETMSRPDLPPVMMLRDTTGRSSTVITQADVSPLQEEGFVLPEPFTVLSADGKTSLYGNIFRPSDFDPDKTYPVIDSIYPGPQSWRSQKSFMRAVFDSQESQSIAELGFIVITVDGRGTPGRSKAFHDVSYGDLGQAGHLDDHIAAIQQLAERYPYMDTARVGIYGHSGGGFASTRAMLSYPEFYKVAVSSAGNHDQRGYLLSWGETYQGPFSDAAYENGINARHAKNLKGKLLIAHGDMDDNVHPALTLQVIDALIKANKNFDMLMIPNADHAFTGVNAYFLRRRWDYFVQHLLGMTPPQNYEINRKK
ncbi:S9 family peptidase [Paremcibacter congregatus]|nr:DPP IV N-terminal domain-containing protein [Paremcibacter congregatus]